MLRHLFFPVAVAAVLSLLYPHVAAEPAPRGDDDERPIAPRVMIVSMVSSLHTPSTSFEEHVLTVGHQWEPEAQVWYDRFPSSDLGNLTKRQIPVAGLSMIFPTVACTWDRRVCQMTVGEGEVNAATSMAALVFSDKFDLRRTYFLLAGIAGVNPRKATLGSVALARYAVQVALQYEIDPRSLPDDWSTGYFAYGTDHPDDYPTITYGTEVFELNADLRDFAYQHAANATMADSDGPAQYRARYNPEKMDRPKRKRSGEGDVEDESDEKDDSAIIQEYKAASGPPSVVKCDSATSDVYYSGTRLAEAFENTTALWTNGTGEYCMTAQEDNAILEVMVRGDIERRVDFQRIVLMRSGKPAAHTASQRSQAHPSTSPGSNFDRPPPDLSDLEHLTYTDQNGFSIAIENLFNAGMPVIREIINDWECTFRDGIPAQNYVGDIFGSLGGDPDFGLGSITDGERVQSGGGHGGSDGGDGHEKKSRRGAWRGAAHYMRRF